MPKKKKHIRVDHYRKILDKYPVSVNQIGPGDLFGFKYKGDNIFDKNQLVIFIYYERNNRLIHGINLNYLYEDDVQNLFKRIHKTAPVTGPHINESMWTKVNLSSSGIFSGKRMYENSIKPYLAPGVQNSYRTYKKNNMSNIKLIKYDLDRIKLK